MRRMIEGIDSPRIFIGSLNTANDAGWLLDNSIRVILNVCNDIESARFDGIVYCKWGLDDPKDTLAPRNNVDAAAVLLSWAATHAERLGGNILIHCAAGNNRSALVAAVYLKEWVGWNWKRAIEACQVKDLKNWMVDQGFSWEVNA